MPTYEYRCLDCNATFTLSEHISEHAAAHPRCPKCRSERVEQQFTSFYAKTARKS